MEPTHNPGLERWLERGLMKMPDHGLKICLKHMEKGLPVITAYGWLDPERRAEVGNLVSLTFSRPELNASADEQGLRWLAEEVFPLWALQFIDDVHRPLPAFAIRKLMRLLRTELKTRRD